MRRPAWLLVLVAVATVDVESGARRPPVIYPAAEWERVDRPETAGWSTSALERARQKLTALPSTGLLAVAGGRVVFEYGDVRIVSYLASVRKSVLAMLYGAYVASGRIRLNKTLAQIGLDDLGGLTAEEKEATIADLLMARSGIYHPASNAGDDTDSAPPRRSQKHGAYFLYNNWDFNAAGTVFEKETGRDIYDALESDLARPLGMQEFDRAAHRKSGDLSRSIHPAYHMHLSTRDMARLGYLMLREGLWAGKQVVPRDWVREISRAQTPVTEMNPIRRRDGPWGYGYLWWVWDGPRATGPYAGAYTAHGAFGQHITVMPALDLVVVHKTMARQGRVVTHEQYLEVLDAIVRGRLPR
jgi:CubicO group peptidase (beta-lactamase class C family)